MGARETPLTITLTTGELYVGAAVGVARRLAALKRGRPEVYGPAGPHYWQVDIEAALAEMAAAKALNRYWKSPLLDSVGGSLDLEGVNVRSTPHANGHLILYPRDADEVPFVLVRGVSPTYDLAGWCYGRDGKLTEFWRTDVRNACFMVPASKLRNINDLLFVLGGAGDARETA